MLTVGLSAEDAACVWQCVAALMLLGNIDFGSGDRGVVGDVATMRRASDMLGCGDVQVSKLVSKQVSSKLVGSSNMLGCCDVQKLYLYYKAYRVMLE